MIPVGLHLTDKAFAPPEDPIAKFPKAAKDDPKMILDGIDKNTKKQLIKRIVLNGTSSVQFLRAESPSCIWVRLANHITDNLLTFREPFKLVPLRKISVGDYALAPFEERTFRRCRILKEPNHNDLIKIFFIDDAFVAWVKPECLAELPEHYFYYPWQAIKLSLFGVYPAVNSNNETKWTPETCEKLTQILYSFPNLRVEVVLSTVIFNDYARPIVVKLFGIEEDVEEKDHKNRTVEIREILEKDARNDVVCMDLYDSAYHEVFEVAEEEVVLDKPNEYQECIPADWKHTDDKEEMKKKEEKDKIFENQADSLTLSQTEDSDWDPRLNKIEMLTIKQLAEQFQFPKESDDEDARRIMLAVEGKCTKNPFEWYARPIVKIGMKKPSEDGQGEQEMIPWTEKEELSEVDMVDWLLYGNQQLLNFAEQMDKFYSNEKNRKPLQPKDIQAMRDNGKKEIFAVCAVNEDKAQYTGEWQRVLIIHCETFAEVRFLDSGGRDLVLTSSLYKIHKQHCRFPPMCLRFSMHGIVTHRNRTKADRAWHATEVARFKSCLREDVPIFINIDDITPMIPPPKDPRQWLAKHVLMVKNVTFMDETKSLMERFMEPEDNGSVFAIRDQNEPVPWTPSS